MNRAFSPLGFGWHRTWAFGPGWYETGRWP